MLSGREPLTACSIASSHSPSVALRSGSKVPPLRSASITAEHRRRQRRQQLAVDDRAGVEPSSLHVERVVAARLVERPDHLGDAALLRRARFAQLDLRRRWPSVTSSDSAPVALAGISIGRVRTISSPRYVRSSTFNGTVRPARGRGSSSHTRSSVRGLRLLGRGRSSCRCLRCRPSRSRSHQIRHGRDDVGGGVRSRPVAGEQVVEGDRVVLAHLRRARARRTTRRRTAARTTERVQDARVGHQRPEQLIVDRP